MNEQRIIVAGGAGYIGSHICVDLLENGASLLVIDDFSNSDPRVLERVREITGINDPDRLQLIKADLAAPADQRQLSQKTKNFRPTGAIHLAGLKAVGESVAQPARYYQTNINATFCLLELLTANRAKTLVFSSSATVYGDLNNSPVDETGKTGPTNPYGHTKHMIEQILSDVAEADHEWRIANLRYFNPVGAHKSGRIGEDPNDIPNNLFPYIAQVAVGRRDKLSVYGDDYQTRDGTGVRDYIHVCDLADGHLKALTYLLGESAPPLSTFNLGTGDGLSVLEVIQAFSKAADRDIPYEITARRAGDIAEIFADASKAQKTLGWSATRSLNDMCADHWRWQSSNPQGFNEDS